MGSDFLSSVYYSVYFPLRLIFGLVLSFSLMTIQNFLKEVVSSVWIKGLILKIMSCSRRPVSTGIQLRLVLSFTALAELALFALIVWRLTLLSCWVGPPPAVNQSDLSTITSVFVLVFMPLPPSQLSICCFMTHFCFKQAKIFQNMSTLTSLC